MPGPLDWFDTPDIETLIPQPPRSGVVQLLVVDGLVPAEAENLFGLGFDADFDALLVVLAGFGLPFVAQRVVRSVSPQTILDWEALAAGTALPPLTSLTRYWEIEVGDDPVRVDAVLEAAALSPGVVRAWERPVFQPPTVNAANDTYAAQQTHLRSASLGGIDADWMWTQVGGDGAGVRWVDIEQGWTLDHADLPAPTLLSGYNDASIAWHGTAVLGLVSGMDNAQGIVGIAPAATMAGCISIMTSAVTQVSVASAVAEALLHLGPGDVLLIEEETTTNFPVEVNEPEFNAIRLASALGVICIEPAGNAEGNLDTEPATATLLGRAANTWRDSGAVMVGAAIPSSRNRLSGTRYGSRVDCWAFGANIVSSGGYDLAGTANDPQHGYTALFGMTSGASAIVAGAAILVQSHYRAQTGGTLTPLQMRTILPASGTAASTAVVGNIGKMPNLNAIVTTVLAHVPDVYVRDRVGDTGTVPVSGVLAHSPDLLVTQSRPANPNALWGEGSGTENDDTLADVVRLGEDNYVYVRVRNRGVQTASGVTARVYWTEPTTLPLPSTWRLIGTSGPANIPADDKLRVLPEIVWSRSNLPAAGPHCLIGLVGCAADPMPLLPSLMDPFQFLEFVANNNNVAWRNVVVVPSWTSLPLLFTIAGAEDGVHRFDLEIRVQAPAGTRVRLLVPVAFARLFGVAYGLRVERVAPLGDLVAVTFPTLSRYTLPRVPLPRAARIPARWEITGPPPAKGDGVSILQSFQGTLIGAIHWRVGSSTRSQFAGPVIPGGY